MTTYPSPGLPPVRQAGPNVPSYSPPVKRTVWPKVIGIISIVIAGLGMLCGTCNTISGIAGRAMVPFMRGMFKMPMATSRPTTGPTMPIDPKAAADMMDKLLEGMTPLYTIQAITSFVGLLAAILLLVGGIKLIRRRRCAQTLHLVYAILGIISVCVAIALHSYSMSIMTDTMGGLPFGEMDPGMDPAMGEQMSNLMRAQFSMMSVFGAIMIGATGLPYPVFLLVWFLRPKVRREVEGWNGPAAEYGTR